MAGGGSGGHVTPALAILEALAASDPKLEVCFICDKKFAPQAQTILAKSSLPITLRTVYAGKLRRYHGVPLWKQLLDLPTVWLNLRDSLYIGIGYLQSRRIMRQFKPAVVFGKGGFVCMPVGLAAHKLGIPLVIHDSDAHPGLTNRVLSRWATTIATGAPLENYPYDRSRTHFVGIPVGPQFVRATADEQAQLKRTLMHDATRFLIAVVGGGLGAATINEGMVKSAQALIAEGAEIIHVTGKAHGSQVTEKIEAALSAEESAHYQIKPFIDADDMAALLKAADVVVSRGGATAIAELSMLGKPTVLVPGAKLTGGQQLKNAKALEAAQAVLVVDDNALQKDHRSLLRALLYTIKNRTVRHTLGQKIRTFAKPEAASDVATLIVQAARQGRGK